MEATDTLWVSGASDNAVDSGGAEGWSLQSRRTKTYPALPWDTTLNGSFMMEFHGAVRPSGAATGAPTISGTAQVGKTLTADTSRIADADGLANATFSYQWLADNGDISGAMGSTYTPVADDEHKHIRVRVSFTDDAGSAESLTSASTTGVRMAATCPGTESAPTPTPTVVEVKAVPIVIDSTTEEYFVLYVRHERDSETMVDIPVSVTLGQDGTTTLTEELPALPKERYRVEKFLIADPADIDGDCIDDVTELADPVGMNPLNPAPAIGFVDGAVAIPDRTTFEALSYQGEDVLGDLDLTGLEFVKFYLVGPDTDRPSVYFMNTETHRAHDYFKKAIDLWALTSTPAERTHTAMDGEIIYHPNVIAPDGSLGVYRYQFGPFDDHSFEDVAYSHEVLAASMPLLDNNLAYSPFAMGALPLYHQERALYDDSRVKVLLEEDIFPDVDFIPLNREEGYGFLRVMALEERPSPRDVVIYETLPNELSRVAGIITTVPQTPLSHVNLRAVQDGVPNAFIRDALEDADIDDLIDGYVHYTVAEDGWTLRAATPLEVDAHHAASRPKQTQALERNLVITQITPLREIGFGDWTAFGVKAANVAVLGTLDFPEGTVPDGFAVPFYFYDEFMKANGFYDDIEEMLADPDFQSDYDTQNSKLKKLRKKIKKGETPEWVIEALTAMHATYPEGQSLRYRSSTNNEDLPGFSGAGLYDSKTQDPDETEEDGIDKSIKGVWASLWNFRAFVEREFHRIDHTKTAMGVLVHPNYSDELANGVAVSFDPVGGTDGTYYVNTQIGEDLVTNPEAYSVPEEILLHRSGTYDMLATSNQVPRGQLLMTDAQMNQLRRHLKTIHDKFAELYGIIPEERFAMEIEFKITSDNILSIKQARPWVFPGRATGRPTITGTAQVGETLTADVSGIADADGLVNATFSYQWQADGSGIASATASTYTLTDAEEGKTIRARVSFTDDAGNAETMTSAATAAVESRGYTLWSDTLTVGENDAGAVGYSLWGGGFGALTAPNFTVDGDQNDVKALGHKDGVLVLVLDRQLYWKFVLRVGDREYAGGYIGRVSHGNYQYRWEAADSPLTAGETVAVSLTGVSPLPNSPATGAPIIRGAAQVGATLRANKSGIADADGLVDVSFSHQWRADGTDIAGATGSSYTLVDADEGKTVSVTVAFTDDRDHSESVTSVATGAVETRPNTPATGLLTISGTAQVGETLTADTSSIADEDGLDAVSFAYQWAADGADIAGATSSTYILADADEGKAISVAVSFTDDAGHAESLTSAATQAVAGPPPEPLTASFSNGPSSHDGESVFTFELHFSEEFSVSYKTLRDQAFIASGGDVTRAKRLERGSNVGWRIHVRPDGDGAVSIILPVTTDCEATGAICTGDGRMLSNRSELTMSGP